MGGAIIALAEKGTLVFGLVDPAAAAAVRDPLVWEAWPICCLASRHILE